MNIRAKIVLTWLLFLAWGILMYFHFFGAWFLYLAMILLRQSIPRPKSSTLGRRIGYTFAAAFITFLVLVLIHSFHPFPAWLVTTGEVVGVIVLIPVVIYGIHSDYVLFTNSNSRA
jgi:hypothetical protein